MVVGRRRRREKADGFLFVLSFRPVLAIICFSDASAHTLLLAAQKVWRDAFHALKDSDSDSDDEDSVLRCDADKHEKANNLFLQALLKTKLSHFLLRQPKKLPLQGVKNQGESSLLFHGECVDSLGDDVKQLTRENQM